MAAEWVGSDVETSERFEKTAIARECKREREEIREKKARGDGKKNKHAPLQTQYCTPTALKLSNPYIPNAVPISYVSVANPRVRDKKARKAVVNKSCTSFLFSSCPRTSVALSSLEAEDALAKISWIRSFNATSFFPDEEELKGGL